MSDSVKQGHLPWLRLIGEMTAIAIGVLLALAADAAWNSRQDRTREREYLEALHVEMRAARAEFETDHRRRIAGLAAIDSVRAQFRGRTATDEAIVNWILESRQIAVFYPPSAVFQDLVSSGNLQLLRSEELRFALMEYQQNSPRLRFLEDREQIFIEQEYRPYLVQAIAFDGPQPAGAVGRLLSDLVFRNLVETRRFRLDRTLEYSALVEQAIDRAIESLESERHR